MARRTGVASILVFAAGIILLVILAAYAVGYIAGRMILGAAAL